MRKGLVTHAIGSLAASQPRIMRGLKSIYVRLRVRDKPPQSITLGDHPLRNPSVTRGLGPWHTFSRRLHHHLHNHTFLPLPDGALLYPYRSQCFWPYSSGNSGGCWLLPSLSRGNPLISYKESWPGQRWGTPSS